MAYTVDENGNYKRTVRCGYCYEVGHNKSSCPQKKQNHKDMIAAYEKEIAEDNFTDEWERNYAQRKLDHHKAELNKTANRGKHRKCSYCKEEGHTRRTCSYRKGDMEDWIDKCLAAREKFIENMTAVGFGIGALGYRKDPWGGNRELVMIEHISWDSINHTIALGSENQYRDVFSSRSFNAHPHYPGGRLWQLQLPPVISNIDGQEIDQPRSHRSVFELISPSPATFPEDLLTRESAAVAAKRSEIFQDSRPYEYRDIEYDN